MLTPRTLGRPIARLMVGVLLFARIAVSAYACTSGAGAAMGGAAGADAAMTMAAASMADPASGNAGHGAMDPAQPNLCAAHCRSGEQNAGAKPLPDLPATSPVSLYPLAPVTLAVRKRRAVAAAEDPPPVADPPHAILHCCFRI
ncbi:MAG: hypothetical protein MUC86_00505 [Burkholderiaceae bacterium]|nr:hypothetical protein [Burkholderiaceae bacterium]